MLTHTPTLQTFLRSGQSQIAKSTLFCEVCNGYLMRMDIAWFKQQQRRAGVTSLDIAQAIGRDRSVVSRIYHGRQPLSFEQAKAFAEVLGVPLHDVLVHSGLAKASEAQGLRPGHAESDVAVWHDEGRLPDQLVSLIGTAGPHERPLEAWSVKSGAMRLAGVLSGDVVFVEQNPEGGYRQGDLVVAISHDIHAGVDMHLLRRFEPPVLVAFGIGAGFDRVQVLDFNRVSIYGRVRYSFRAFNQLAP